MADRHLALRGKIERRVQLSADLVKAMGMDPQAYTRVALNALIMNPAIADCTPDSIDKALLRCIESRLLPDGIHAAIVPFRKEAQLITMVDGRALLARRATPGLAMRARVVYDGEHFIHEEGLRAVLEHKPDPKVPHGDEHIVAAYGVADLPGGAQEWVVLYRVEIDEARAMAKTQKVWGPFYGRMAEKTVLHRLLKRLPRMPGDPPDFDEVEQEPEPAQPTIVGPLAKEEVAQGVLANPDDVTVRAVRTEEDVPVGAVQLDGTMVVEGQPVDDEAASPAFDGQGGDDDSPF